jgi:hypothetical protein
VLAPGANEANRADPVAREFRVWTTLVSRPQVEDDPEYNVAV